jgi:hypothetical protein
MGTRASLSNQVCSLVLREASDNISFRLEQVWIINCKIAFCHCAVKGREKVKSNGMSCSRGTGADRLFRDGKIQAHDSVLEKANATSPDRLSDNGAKCRVQERPRALRRFPPKLLSLVNPDRNVDELPRKLLLQLTKKFSLPSVQG